MMVLMTFFSGLIVLALWLPSTANAPIIVFAALFGFGSGAYVSLIPAIIAQISDIREIGVRNGALFAVASIGALCGNPIGGALITTNHGGFRDLQIFSGVMMLTGATFYTLARTSLVGLALVKKV
jgi:MFS family permease